MNRNICLNLSMVFLINCSFSYSNQQEAIANVETIHLSSKEVECHPNPAIQEYADEDVGYPKNFSFVKNFPINKAISCSCKRLAQEGNSYTKFFEFFMNEERKFISTSDSQDTCSVLCASSKFFLPGERVFIIFASHDKTFKIETSFIPNPIKAKTKDGKAFIEAELISIKPAVYQFTFTGFKENEMIKTISISGKEKLKGSFKLLRTLKVSNSPDVKHKKGGIAKNIFIRESGEHIEINLPWGIELINYAEGKKIYRLS